MAKKSNNPLHVTIAVGKWKNYRVFHTCEALHKYIQTILNKGYHAYLIEVWDTTLKPGRMISSWNAICDSIFEFGVVLKKGGMKDIYVSETAKPSKKTPSKKTTKSKPGLSAPITIPDEGYRNWTLVEEDVKRKKESYKRFQSYQDAFLAFFNRAKALQDAGWYRKKYSTTDAIWEGDYITESGKTETTRLKVI